jgi:hypothetical protein
MVMVARISETFSRLITCSPVRELIPLLARAAITASSFALTPTEHSPKAEANVSWTASTSNWQN